MQTLGPLAGKPQAVPPAGAAADSRVPLGAEPPRLVIPADWPSGVYLGRLSRAQSRRHDALAELRGVYRPRRPAGRHPLPVP